MPASCSPDQVVNVGQVRSQVSPTYPYTLYRAYLSGDVILRYLVTVITPDLL